MHYLDEHSCLCSKIQRKLVFVLYNIMFHSNFIRTFAPAKERNKEKRTKKKRKSIARMLIDSY